MGLFAVLHQRQVLAVSRCTMYVDGLVVVELEKSPFGDFC